MEKPIRIGPLCGARTAPAVEVSCGSFTQDALSRRQNRANIFLIDRSFAPLLYQKAAVEVEPLTRREAADEGALQYRPMTLRRLFRPALAAALLLVLSCGSTNAYAGRQRAVRSVPATQWNHE
jgi:hypothetical protein